MTNSEIISTANKSGLVEFFNTMVKNGHLAQQDLSDYQAGKKVFYTADLYVRKYLGQALSGEIQAITENEVEYLTRCNLSKGRIPDEMNVIMSHFSLRFGESTTDYSTTPERVKYTNCIYDLADVVADAGRSAVASTSVFVQRIPNAFINGEYELKCDDGLVDKGRISEHLVNNTATQHVQGAGDNAKLYYWPKLLPAGKTLRLTLKFPSSAVSGTDYPASTYYFVEASVKGMYLGRRPGA